MVRLASVTDATYEPYTNGASPNPTYPQEIQSATGTQSVVVSGKNLFDINNLLIAGTSQAQINNYSPRVVDGVLQNGGVRGYDGGAMVCVKIKDMQNITISFTPKFTDTNSFCELVWLNSTGIVSSSTLFQSITLSNNTKVTYTATNINNYE